jgi:predicted ribosome quality control (RQC) complex YloA/Tae2 family protein
VPIYSVLDHTSNDGGCELREFTSFDVAVAVRELKETILNSRVNNVYQLDSKTLLLKLHKADRPPTDLILEAGKQLHLTSYVLEKPTVPPAFCMALRKHIRNARLTGLEQYEFERVVTLDFKSNEGSLRLVTEFFGEGNIILIDGGNKILQALNYKRMRDRNILRHEAFQFAPPSGKNPLRAAREELFEELMASGEVEVVRVLARRLSVGGTYAEEILLRAKVDKTKQCSALSQDEVSGVFEGLQNLVSQAVEGPLEPFIVLNNEGDLVDVVPFRLQRYEGLGFKLQTCNSFNEALDEFYTRVASVAKALAGLKVDQLKREAERLKRIIADQQNVLAEAEANVVKNRSVGDTIYAHTTEAQTLLDRFLLGKQKGKKWDAIVSEILAEREAGLIPSVFFESFDSKTGIISVCIGGLRFGLDLHMNLFENASGFYEKSKRAKQKLDGAKAALDETRKKAEEAEAKISHAEALEHVRPTQAMEEIARSRVKHRKWFEKFRWFTSSDEFLVVAGKDAVSNEVLIKKHTEPEDIVFHADIVGAPFVVVKTGGRQSSEQVLTEAAEFAASFSRGWREGFASIDVYWVKPEQLSKSGPSGQHVAHGAFVVNGKRNWKRNVQLRVAVGILSGKDETTSFIGGPIDSVKAKTQIYVVIAPGDYAGKRLFEHVLRTLAGKMPENDRQSILKASVEEIREFIPFGVGKVLQS